METSISNRVVYGPNCRFCGNKISKKSQVWLGEMEVDKNNREIVIKSARTRYVVDGFEEETNTVFEYFGSFWHGNPNVYDPDDINKVNKKTFGELFKKTKEKVKNLLKDGYDICFTWGK